MESAAVLSRAGTPRPGLPARHSHRTPGAYENSCAVFASHGTIVDPNSLTDATPTNGAIIFGDFEMGFEYGGILGIIILILNIWAILQIIKGGGTTGSKLLWILLILVLPVIGLIIWLLAGRNRL